VKTSRARGVAVAAGLAGMVADPSWSGTDYPAAAARTPCAGSSAAQPRRRLAGDGFGTDL